MKVDEWFDFFKKNTNKKLFSLSDILLLIEEERSTITVQLSRLVRSGLVDHPVRGWYVNPFKPPTNEEMAMVIRNPSYLSLEYALSKHGILSQNVFTYTLVTTKLPYFFRTPDNIFEYHQVKRTLFWGYLWDGSVNTAEPEKALLDLIYIRSVKGRGLKDNALASLLDDMYLEDLDRKKLSLYSEKFDSATRTILSKRVV